MGTRDFLGTGFAFPPSVDPATGRFRMAKEEDDIRQSIYIILMTRKGEYAMQPNFGSNVHEYVFELPDDAFASLISTEIIQALAAWEPRIVDVGVRLDSKDLKDGKVVFDISYVVRSTNNPNNLVFPYYLYEGNNAE